MKHRDLIALLRSYLRLRRRSPRDSRSFHRPFHPFTVLWTGKPTALPAPSPPPSFHLYQPPVPRPLFGLNGPKVSLFISLSCSRSSFRKSLCPNPFPKFEGWAEDTADGRTPRQKLRGRRSRGTVAARLPIQGRPRHCTRFHLGMTADDGRRLNRKRFRRERGRGAAREPLSLSTTICGRGVIST